MPAQLSFFLPQDLKDQVEKLANDAGIPISVIGRLGMQIALPELRKRFGNLQTGDPPAQQKPTRRKPALAKG
jgi:hypothetical protein